MALPEGVNGAVVSEERSCGRDRPIDPGGGPSSPVSDHWSPCLCSLCWLRVSFSFMALNVLTAPISVFTTPSFIVLLFNPYSSDLFYLHHSQSVYVMPVFVVLPGSLLMLGPVKKMKMKSQSQLQRSLHMPHVPYPSKFGCFLFAQNRGAYPSDMLSHSQRLSYLFHSFCSFSELDPYYKLPCKLPEPCP